MDFQIGDTVIHSSHGLAEIVGLEQKAVASGDVQFYVVRTKDLTIWVPSAESGKGTLRRPAEKKQFIDLLSILRGTIDPLSVDRMERKTQLQTRMHEGNSGAICRLVRDLSFFRLTNKLNENDSAMLERAMSSLLDEWQYALAIPLPEAKSELKHILEVSFQVLAV